MARLLRGAETASAIIERTSQRAQALRMRGITPSLAIIRVGQREDDIAYERGAIRRCAQVGVETLQIELPQTVTQLELMGEMIRLSRDRSVHGMLLMQPLPDHLDGDAVRRALTAEKDIDGITDASLAGVLAGNGQGFAPCTAQACLEILDHYGIELAGKRAVVVGRSLVIGKPVAMLLLGRNATVTICHTRTKNLEAVCREADILVVAAGKAGVIGSDAVSPGQTVIDVGIHVGEDGRLCGDVRFEEVQEIVQAITPVPDGVGTVTTSVLAAHVVEAAGRTSVR